MAKKINPNAGRIKDIEKLIQEQGTFKDNPAKEKFIKMLKDELKLLKNSGWRK